MRTVKSGLVGGVLATVGAMASTAIAQSFQFETNQWAVVGAYDYLLNNETDFGEYYGPGPVSVDASVSSASGSAKFFPSVFASVSYSSAQWYAGYVLNHFTYFRASADMDAVVKWDFSGDLDGPDGFWTDSFIEIDDVDAGFVRIFEIDVKDPVGSAKVPLKGGTLYHTRGATIAVNGGGFSQYTIAAGGCYADFDGNGVLTLFDFLEFLNAFNTGKPVADCTADGSLNLFDFLCFTNEFNDGCGD